MGLSLPVAMIAGAGLSSAVDLIGGSSARRESKEQADQMMDFQERMSSTAYQRSVADMRAAGINPALMFGGGGPSSTPSGAQAPIENIMDGIGDQVVSSALDARRLKKEIEETDARIDQADTQADLNKEAAKTQENVRKLQDSQAHVAEATAQGVRSDNVKKDIDADLLKKNKWLRVLDAISDRVLPWSR